MTSEQMKRVESGLTTLVLEQPFFAVLAMKLEHIETTDIPTFAVDGERLFINPDFCKTLKDTEIVTVLAHEVMHCAMGHLWRLPDGADRQVWNQAVDNETNWELEEANIQASRKSRVLPFPWPACGKEMQDRFKGMASELVYKKLMEEQKQGGSKGKQPNQGGGNGFGELIPVAKNSKNGKQIKEQWERSVIQATKVAKNKGFIPGKIEEMIKRITSNKLDWRSILRDYLSTKAKEDWSFRSPNTRYVESDFILPSLHNEKMGSLVFAIDTSGSIDSALLSMFIGEAQLALDDLNPENLTVIYCDSVLQDVQTYQPGELIKEKVTGRGGTDFTPVFDWCRKQEEIPKVVVYLTDLEGVFPKKKPEHDTIWICMGNETKAPFGEVINI